MAHILEPERNPKFQQKTSGNGTLPQASHKSRLQGKISAQHCNTTKQFQTAYPVSSASHQTQWKSGKTPADELIRYMTNMPSYLERGKRPQEKVLSVGVLDWGRLEKWQSVYKLAPHRYSSYSPTSSNTSSSYSADCSTSDSSGRKSCSPGCQRTRRSLQLHLMASPLKNHSSAVEASRECETKPKELKFVKSGELIQHDNFSRTRMPLPKSYPDTIMKQSREKESDVMSSRGYNASLDRRNYKEATNVNMEDKPTQRNQCAAKLDARVRVKESVSVPRELPETKTPGACHLSDSRPILGLRSEEVSQKIFPEKVKIRHAKFISDTSQSCTVPEEAVSRTRVKSQSVVDTDDEHKLVSQPTEVGISPSALQNSQKKKLSATRERELSKELNLNMGKAVVEKPRSTSPFRRLSISITKAGKSVSSKEDGIAPQTISKSQTSKYNSENGMPPACTDNLSCDRPSSAARSRSSPLRRLLDPLLKPRGSRCHQSPEQLLKGSTSENGGEKSSNAQVEHSSIQSAKARLDMSSCKTAGINCSSKNMKNGSLAVQALVRVAFKNGLPLITFAVGSDSNVLIATMKKSGFSDKDQRSWVYTIFDVQDVKKKNGSWRNQGGKGKCPGYVSHVVAEMNVYDSKMSNSTKASSQELFYVRQFVSFSMNQRADMKASDFQPNDEVAAIVMKIPEKIVEHSSRGESIDNCYTDLGKSMQNVKFPVIQDPMNATVILPSGIHSLPSRGIPSSLIDRWNLGGSCDCGGWDLGCKLTILSNEDPASKKLSSSKACSITKFKLFSQGGQQHEPIFCFSPFKDGAFSVEFNSSLSLVQAFSICIAILDSWKLSELPGSEAEALGETESAQNNGKPIEGGIPARYVAYPPISPVGRV